MKRPHFKNYFENPLAAFKEKDDFLKKIARRIDEEVENKITIIGNDNIYFDDDVIFVGKNSDLEGPCYIGPNCVIGPNSYIRSGTYLEGNNRIGNSSEVKNSILLEGAKLPHFNYVGDSIIGKNCNFGAGTKVANLRLDEKNVKIKESLTGLRKLGVIVGENVKTGINISFYPGEIIESNTYIFIDLKTGRRIIKRLNK